MDAVIGTFYDELAGMLALVAPEQLLRLKAPAQMQKRFLFLAEKNKEEELSRSERQEIERYLMLERLVRLAKIKARTTK